MRVLFITNMYPVPDYIYFGIHVKEQIDALAKYKDIDAEVYFINGRESKLNYFKSIAGIKKRILKGNFDLVHIHYGISGLFLLFFKPATPVVITLHSGELYRKKGLINHLMQKNLTLSVICKVDKIIVLNNDMMSLLNEYNNKLIKLPCGTDLEVFSEKAVKNKEGILIGFPGNKDRKEKNYSLFLDIINLLNKSYSVKVIEFHNLTRAQVVENLSRIDILLMTSTVEGSPQIIKEAMACNKPIISTNVGDVDDLLKDVKNSYVVNSFTAEQFIEPIAKVLNQPLSARHSDGREKLLNMRLGSQQVSERLYSIYKGLL